MSEAVIEVSNNGTGSVIIDGNDLSDHLEGLRLDVTSGQTPVLTLRTHGSPKITRFAGSVQVEIAEPLRATLLLAGWREPA